MQLLTGSDWFVHKVCFLRHGGILMPFTQLAGCAFMAACSLAQGCEKLHSSYCFAMKSTNMAWVAANYGWLIMMEGAMVPSFSVGKPMPGWVGAIPGTVRCKQESFHHFICRQLFMSLWSCDGKSQGCLAASCRVEGTKLIFFGLRGSLRIKGLRFSWHRLLPSVACTRRRKLVFGIRENRETGRHVDF